MLSIGLRSANFGYFTEETVCISSNLISIPYHKPLSIAIATKDTKPQVTSHGPDELELLPCPSQPLAAQL